MTVVFRVFLDQVSLVYTIGFGWERDSKSTWIKRPVLKDLGLEQESLAEFFSEILTLQHCFESGPVKSALEHQKTGDRCFLPRINIQIILAISLGMRLHRVLA